MRLKYGLLMLLFVMVGPMASGTAFAFHDGGVAECSGCHAMHSPKVGGSFLLIGSDQSSTCMSCHNHADTTPSSYHVATADSAMPVGTAPVQRTPGGDFGWLKKTYTWGGSRPGSESGETHGHNVIAADFGYVVDSTNTTAPGGTFPSNQLACNSCHDPHGKYRRTSTGTIVTSGAPTTGSGSYGAVPAVGQAVGAYRLLAGLGYTKGPATFTGVPAAVTPSAYNRTEASTQTRTAYGVATSGNHATWSNWCATCHPNFHSTGNVVHPVDQNLGSTIAANYNTYVNTGNTTGGSAASSFLSLVPFAEGTSDYTVLASHAKNDNSQLGGPSSGDQVTCLSCHRAHASGWKHALRWNPEYEMLTFAITSAAAWPGTDNGAAVNMAMGRLSTETQAAYYDRPATVFGPYQRSLCNKCHAMD